MQFQIFFIVVSNRFLTGLSTVDHEEGPRTTDHGPQRRRQTTDRGPRGRRQTTDYGPPRETIDERPYGKTGINLAAVAAFKDVQVEPESFFKAFHNPDAAVGNWSQKI